MMITRSPLSRTSLLPKGVSAHHTKQSRRLEVAPPVNLRLEAPEETLGRLALRVVRRHRLPELLPLLDDRVGLAGAVQHVELALDHLRDRLAGRAKVVARVELGGLRGEDFADL